MPKIFPGMDPYLEHHQLWPGVHSRLIVYLADMLNPLLRPRYVAAIEERVFVEGPDRQVVPDVWIRQSRAASGASGRFSETSGGTAVLEETEVDEPLVVWAKELEIRETYLEILDLHSQKRVVTVIEALSPTNKASGAGQQSYLAKQAETLARDVHLVEIDLLRGGDHVLAVPRSLAPATYHYLVSVNRAGTDRGGLNRERFELYPMSLRTRLARIRIPLAGDDPDVRLDLQAAIERVLEFGGYEDRIDYQAPCDPRLAPAEQAWADALIRAAAAKTGEGNS